MDELLLEAFRHNGWATRRLLAFCRDLTRDQLRATPPGTYGTILETLNHIIYSDAGYLPRTKVTRPAWVSGDEEEIADFDQLEARLDETVRLWEAYLSEPLDARILLILDAGAYEAQSSVPVVQALHHGNAHREQVCAIVTALGVQPPDLQAWTYAEETGLAREVPSGGSATA